MANPIKYGVGFFPHNTEGKFCFRKKWNLRQRTYPGGTQKCLSIDVQLKEKIFDIEHGQVIATISIN